MLNILVPSCVGTRIDAAGDLERNPLPNRQPMKLLQRWRDAVVFPCTNNQPSGSVPDAMTYAIVTITIPPTVE